MSDTGAAAMPLSSTNHDATAAAQRVASQDTTHFYALLTQQSISRAVYDLMISQLAFACHSSEAAFVQFTQKGVELMRTYTTLSFAQQLLWIRADLLLRAEIYAQDERLVQRREHLYAQNKNAQDNYAGLDDCFGALLQRMQINGEQIGHLQNVEADLVALLPCQPSMPPAGPTSQALPEARIEAVSPTASGSALLDEMRRHRASTDPEFSLLMRAVATENATPEQLKTFGAYTAELEVSIAKGHSAPEEPSQSTLAPRATPAQAIQSERPMPTPTQTPSQRVPLQVVPANKLVKPEPQQLKRKREPQQPSANPQTVSVVLDDPSDNEEELEGQLAALQAKIAAIHARTSREDELGPKKKAKKTTSSITPATSQAASSLAPQNGTHSQCPFTSDKSPFDDPFKPPPRAQDIRSKLSMKGAPAKSSSSRLPTQNTLLSRGPEARPVTVKGEMLPSVKREAAASTSQKLAVATSRTAQPAPPQPVVDLTSSSPMPQPEPAAAIPVSEPTLCAEQQHVVDLILAGENVFYTGSAGCGKSTVLKSFVPKLRDQGKVVRIVAPTGKAALDINGSTTWTYAGWTPSHFKQPLEELLKAAHGKFVRARFMDTDVLVIDEISMVENHMLQRLDAVMKEARGSAAAFGGVQLVVTGDFCQLPPVKPFQFCMSCGRGQTQRIAAGKVVYRCPQHGDCKDDDKWAFRSKVWEDCNFKHINLSQIHRQSDKTFIQILQKLRVGTPLTNEGRRLLLDHACDVTNAVKLFPRRLEVKRINDTEFERLKSPKHSYTCLDFFNWNEKHGNLQSKGIRNRFDDSLDALREHRLECAVDYKVGMLVVLLVNLDIAAGLVNGSQGKIIGFEHYDPAKLPKATVYESGGNRTASSKRKPPPGRYGSSSQRRSRARDTSPEPSILVQGDLRGEHALLRESQIRQFLERPCNVSKQWPIVEFDNGIQRTIYAECQVNELGDEKPFTLLARTQIPLIAAWAMTIHKSQGMTLNKVIVDLGSSFEEGQEYVALSRARSLDGLKVLSLGSGGGKGGNEQVKEFLWRKFRIR